MRRVMAVALGSALLVGCGATGGAKSESRSTPPPASTSSAGAIGASAGPGGHPQIDEATRNDIEQLANRCIPFALKQIEDTGELYPFAGMMMTDGEFKGAVAKPENVEHPTSEQVIGKLVAGLREEAAAKRIKATCIVAGGRMAPTEGAALMDAVQGRIEHIGGVAVEVYVPYTRDAKAKRVKPGEAIWGPGRPEVFTGAAPTTTR
ncbi:MAG: hypothetical protein KIT14_04460 [bacterium]|nr:hypothetical protein [bacterium]